MLDAGQNALQRISGAGAFVALARAAWLVSDDATDKHRRHLLPLKENYADTGGLSFEIKTTSVEIEDKPAVIPFVNWTGASSADPNESLDVKAKSDDALAAAGAFLQEFLWPGPRDASEVLAAASEKGISERTLRRAKDKLHVDSFRKGEKWMWRLKQDQLLTCD